MSDTAARIRAGFDAAGVRPPNFFIVGAPKCGTTSMALSLGRHPDIFMAPTKEPHFFGRDLESESVKAHLELADYIRLFRASGQASRIGEASVWYLRSKTAAEEIHDFSPDARIMVMLRNPIDVLQSFHSQALRSGIEHIRDLRTALEAESVRRLGLTTPPRVKYPGRLLYSEVVDFSNQLLRYRKVFGSDAVYVVLFDDILRDPATVMRDTQEFLDVRILDELVLLHRNESRIVRNLHLQSFVRQPPHVLRRIARTLLPAAARVRLGTWITRCVEIVNLEDQRPAKMSPALRLQLSERFRPEVERLSELLERDLSEWLRAGQTPD